MQTRNIESPTQVKANYANPQFWDMFHIAAAKRGCYVVACECDVCRREEEAQHFWVPEL